MEPVPVEQGDEGIEMYATVAGAAMRAAGVAEPAIDPRDGERGAPTFIRGVFPQNRGEGIPENEQLRIGMRARIEPGKTVPITVSWRQDGKRASLVDYGSGTLPVPPA